MTTLWVNIPAIIVKLPSTQGKNSIFFRIFIIKSDKIYHILKEDEYFPKINSLRNFSYVKLYKTTVFSTIVLR